MITLRQPTPATVLETVLKMKASDPGETLQIYFYSETYNPHDALGLHDAIKLGAGLNIELLFVNGIYSQLDLVVAAAVGKDQRKFLPKGFIEFLMPYGMQQGPLENLRVYRNAVNATVSACYRILEETYGWTEDEMVVMTTSGSGKPNDELMGTHISVVGG